MKDGDVERSPDALVFVISGPSGSGKDQVLAGLKKREARFHFVVTTTSRPPRPGEREGVDYHFVSTTEFKRMIQDDEFIEYAQVYDDLKGVPREQVNCALASGKDVILRVDYQGALTIRSKIPDAVLIFLNAESPAEISRRLNTRQTETSETLQTRLKTLERELAYIPDFDYLVINRTGMLEETIDTVMCIMRAEHCRVRSIRKNK